MVSLHVTALGYLIDGKSAAEIYECLKTAGYLQSDRDRESVTTLVKDALQEGLDNTGEDQWWHVQTRLVEAEILSPPGMAAVKRSVMRNGEPVG